MEWSRLNVTFIGNAGRLKKSFTMVYQMLLCGGVLRKRLHLKAYKLCIVQGDEQ
jgi:hypothetical protein